ncbi:ATP-dependent helicase HrpB [Shewanella sp. AS1]|uniref:ATP-dependent helicase HrpB n=1 Tax=Shewanella sp. AS1 TaxID=2907626 RepID=UPI001F2C7854|nr:ATP-dependent helicase HrpB [Shewanella sp. AS1]MCE9677715.1 ATP-dependent helicase HrpB [Shewanella sp. AS1]
MNALPIQALFTDIRQALADSTQLILQAPTGAGKSTALPLAMLDWSEIDGKILMLEPRRMAARNVAQFIAKQRGEPLGQSVGFRVRGESKVSANTRLEVVTEGVLTRMIQQDPELTGYDLVIFDEIHERHLTTDLGLALALEVQGSFREDLILMAMSATLEGLPIQSLMPEAVFLESQGRSFPVEITYRPPRPNHDWLDHMARVIVELLNQDLQTQNAEGSLQTQDAEGSLQTQNAEGSLLAFLPGQREIMRLAQRLSERLSPDEFIIAPLYGSLPAKAQDSAIAAAPPGKRKVVLSTNVAESSLTIEGITLVVDSGYKRQASFNPKTAVSRLSLKRISQSSAAQRAGRAGRLSPGRAIRLWGQEEQGRLLQADEPEILHGDLTSVVLDAALWGVSTLGELPLLSPASIANEAVAWQLLTQLALVDANHRITEHGRKAYKLGCHPRLAHMLLMAAEQEQPSILAQAAVVAGIIESRSRVRRGADILNYLDDARRGEAGQLAQSYLQRMQGRSQMQPGRLATEGADGDAIALLLAWAFPDRIAKARGASGYQLASGAGVVLNEDDALTGEPWLVVADFQESEGQSSGRVQLAARLDPALFDNQLTAYRLKQLVCGWDEKQQKFYAEEQSRLGAIVLDKRPVTQLDDGQIKQAIYALIRAKGVAILGFGDKVNQLRLRLALAQSYQLPGSWPALDDEALLDSLEQWLGPYLDGVRRLSQLQALDFYSLLHNLLPWEQQQVLNEQLPTHWLMKTGTRAQISYELPGRALLSVRLQEALGMAQSPMLAQGKLVVTMALLSPAQRPLALTADLANFWQGPYKEVQKEMKGRYPKHLWPDDPANTLPTKMTKKKTLNSGQ